MGIKADVKLTVICFNAALREFIEENLEEFFIVTNFGTMQDKGFGSYVINKKNDEKTVADYLKNAYGAKYCYAFPGGKAPFKRIKTVYSLMKSGINVYEYERSLLFYYMHKIGIDNEKAWMKQKGIAPIVYKPENRGKEEKVVNGNPKYVRALLGIGDHIDFMNEAGNPKDKTRVSITCKKGGIKRLNSPFFFKVIGGNVYYVAGCINEEIYGSLFKYSSPMESGDIQVPTKEEIGEDFIDRFTEYCMGRLNDGILEKFRDTKNITIRRV